MESAPWTIFRLYRAFVCYYIACGPSSIAVSSQRAAFSYSSFPPHNLQKIEKMTETATWFKELILDLYSDNEEVRIAAIPKILEQGKLGKYLITNLIETETGEIIEIATQAIISLYHSEMAELEMERTQVEQELQAEEVRLKEEGRRLAAEFERLEVNRRKWQAKKQQEKDNQRKRAVQKRLIDKKIQYLVDLDNTKGIEKKVFKDQLRKQIEETYYFLDSNSEQLKKIEKFLDDDDLIESNWQKIREVVSQEVGVEVERCTLESIPAYSFGGKTNEPKLVSAVENKFNFKIPNNFRLAYSKLGSILIYILYRKILEEST